MQHGHSQMGPQPPQRAIVGRAGRNAPPSSQMASRPGQLRPYDMRGAPPCSTHMTGVDARMFQKYLGLCASYSNYLDDGYILVGFRQQSYFRPDLSKPACIYIGWLLTAGMLDACRGTSSISYPYYEYHAVHELQKFIDGANSRQLHEVVYPVVILGMFEVCPSHCSRRKDVLTTLIPVR